MCLNFLSVLFFRCIFYPIYFHPWYLFLPVNFTFLHAFLPHYANEEGLVLRGQLLPIGWLAFYCIGRIYMPPATVTTKMATYDEVVSDLRHLATVFENNANVISIDFIIFRLDALTERVFQLAAHMDTDVDNVVFQNLEEAAYLLNSVANVNHTPGIAGRPVDAVEGLLHAGLPVGAIARLFGVSETTVHRRMAENDIR